MLPGSQRVDLAITHATLLDVRSGRTVPETTVLAAHGLIVGVFPGGDRIPDHRSAQTINARGRLLTPGFIDAHLHTHLIFGDSTTTAGAVNARLVMQSDSIASYRRTLAQTYLPYGVTAVRDVGSDEQYLPMLLAWTTPSASAPDFYPSGAYLVSPESGRKPVAFGVAVADSAGAVAKVQQYYKLGIRNIKLYWRLQPPAFHAALVEAQRLGMNVTAHVDEQVLTIDQAINMGVRNLEHIHVFAMSVMPEKEVDAFYDALPVTLPGLTQQSPGVFYAGIPEFWNHLGPDDSRVVALIDRLKTDTVGVTPTLHVFAGPLGLSYFTARSWRAQDVTTGFTPGQRARAIAGYRIMASYVKRMYEAGVPLRVGTDALDPGKSLLSELLLLHDAGIPMSGVLRIATLETAEGIGHAGEYGSIEVGKRADMILFDRSPLTDPQGLVGPKLVIKDGTIWAH